MKYIITTKRGSKYYRWEVSIPKGTKFAKALYMITEGWRK